jgi:hypothetical protein
MNGMGTVVGRVAALVFVVACSCGKRSEPLRAPDGGSGGGTAAGGVGGVSSPGGSGGTAGGLDAGAPADGVPSGSGGTSGTGGGDGEGGGGGSGGNTGTGGSGPGGASGGGAGGTGGSAGGGAGGVGGSSGSCGGYDQPCCPAPGSCSQPDAICEVVPVMADGGATVTRQLCVRCGQPGQFCCGRKSCSTGCCIFDRIPSLSGRREWVCVEPGAACSAGGSCEADGSCTACGGAGKPCCEEPPAGTAGGAWCTGATTCPREPANSNRTCQPCSQQDQPCCYSTEQAFPVPSCNSPLRCSAQGCALP